MNLHPQLQKLISKPNKNGYYCPICDRQLKSRKGYKYEDWLCELPNDHKLPNDHTFIIYETDRNNKISEIDYSYFSYHVDSHEKITQIGVNFETKILSINNLHEIHDFEFSSIKELLETVETYLLFS